MDTFTAYFPAHFHPRGIEAAISAQYGKVLGIHPTGNWQSVLFSVPTQRARTVQAVLEEFHIRYEKFPL